MLGTTLGLLLGLIAIGLPVAGVLAIMALLLAEIYAPMPLHLAIADIVWANSIDFILVAIPMFVFMGEILLRSGIANRMYDSLTSWIGWMPGGLMHSNIGASALFAATSGSSVATAATVGTIAIPEASKRQYNERLFLGSITSGGTLGILIPPSIGLIIFGLLTNTSVAKLYLAGLIPGIILAALFSVVIILACVLRSDWDGEKDSCSWWERFINLKDLIPPIAIFVVVVGAIYAGVATPTEAAALGVAAAMLLAALNRTLSMNMLWEAAAGTMRTTGMVMLIVLAAIFLNFVLGVIGLTSSMAAAIQSLGLTPTQMIIAIVIFYLVLGCFMESLSMLITTAAIMTELVVALGFDPVWFGVVMMVLLEMALITPPIGINLYVVQGVRKGGDIKDVIIGTLPFLSAMGLMIAILIAFPELATWLPRVVG